MRSDFGLVTLDIHYVLPEDIGEFKCIATNNFGEDATSATLQCQPRAGILADVQHVESWKRIQVSLCSQTEPPCTLLNAIFLRISAFFHFLLGCAFLSGP